VIEVEGEGDPVIDHGASLASVRDGYQLGRQGTAGCVCEKDWESTGLCLEHTMRSPLRQVAQETAYTRRDFLRAALGVGGISAMSRLPALGSTLHSRGKKTVVVTFGGGARDEETFAPQGQENIPHLMNELIPQATFCTQVVNHGILGHYVATASLTTGVYETFDNFADVAPSHPTVFEYFRKCLGRPAHDTWVVAPSNGFNRIGQSDGTRFASGYGAQVILPKRLLAAAAGKNQAIGRELDFLLQDNYEDPLFTPPLVASDVPLQQLDNILHVSVDDFTRHAKTLSSADELSVYVMRQLMLKLAPSLLWITLHDMDVAHTGAYSLYIEGIRRTDRLCAEIWNTINRNPEYAGQTTMFILPDFGRDSDFSSAGNGFQHHRTGDPLSRTTWMMVLGPHVRQNVTVDRPLDSLDLVPTVGALMGFDTPGAQGKPIAEAL
jgi:hypothetical protein